MTILDEIAEKTRERLKNPALPAFETVRREAEACRICHPSFRDNLAKPGINFICEVKKASPSKGIIAEYFPYLDIARDYEAAGAAAISCLTEPFYFKGSDEYLKEIAKEVSIPVLRKDFTVDPYMIYEAGIYGASAVLLICAILSPAELKEYLDIAHSLGLDALVEAHDENEVSMAVNAGAGIIGVNNRNLKDFTVDVNNSVRLRELVPKETVFVSESGIKTPEDIKRLYDNGTNAVLIGESFMRADNKAEKFAQLRAAVPGDGCSELL